MHTHTMNSLFRACIRLAVSEVVEEKRKERKNFNEISFYA